MHRNNLFIKICLWFWLTTLFMIGGVITVDWLTESGPFGSPRPPMHGGPLVSQGQAMAWIYEEEGASALGHFAARLRDLDGIRVQLLDGNGVDLTGGTSAAPAVAPVSLAVTGPSGRTYNLRAELPPRPPGPGGPPSWGMTLIRLIVVLTVSGFICYWLARYLTAPVLKIGAAARRLAAGDLSARVSPALGKRNDELARLALDFDWMAERIGSLLNGQRTLLRDISHELRSPLARLNVALELCRKEAGREAAGALDRIEQESGRLNEMIGHLLTLNRVESDTAVRKTGRIDLAGLVREIAADAEFEAGALKRAVKD
ncbi:MAG: HAMP domain-containing protein, partial [Deltaproteobacteria bacterium]|nr:HAMP domain-containing protein [Deltaproteobacteria bacterium]